MNNLSKKKQLILHFRAQDMDVEDIKGNSEVGGCENTGNEADCNSDGAARGTPSKGSSGEETPIPPPAVGMVFPSIVAIDTYYRSYGCQQGFGVLAAPKGYRGKDPDRRQARGASWTCYHYGRPDPRRRDTGRKRGCPAMIDASVIGDEWQLSKVVNEHKNHVLVPPLPRQKQEMVRAKRPKVDQISNMLLKETNGLDETGISEQDPTNPASLNHGLDHSHGANQRTLPDHVPSECNLVNSNDSTPVATQHSRDSHQQVQEHLDGANDEGTLPIVVLRNDCSRTFVVKATYEDDLVKVNFSLRDSIDLLKELIGKKLNLEVDKFKMKYQDEDKDWVLVADVSDLKDALRVSEASGSNVVRLSILLT